MSKVNCYQTVKTNNQNPISTHPSLPPQKKAKQPNPRPRTNTKKLHQTHFLYVWKYGEQQLFPAKSSLIWERREDAFCKAAGRWAPAKEITALSRAPLVTEKLGLLGPWLACAPLQKWRCFSCQRHWKLKAENWRSSSRLPSWVGTWKELRHCSDQQVPAGRPGEALSGAAHWRHKETGWLSWVSSPKTELGREWFSSSTEAAEWKRSCSSLFDLHSPTLFVTRKIKLLRSHWEKDRVARKPAIRGEKGNREHSNLSHLTHLSILLKKLISFHSDKQQKRGAAGVESWWCTGKADTAQCIWFKNYSVLHTNM